MPTRRPTKAERNRVVSIDLLADWRALADPLPPAAGPRDWRFFGTITIDGTRGALAWCWGKFAIGAGTSLRELGLWDSIKIQGLLQAKPPGIERAPRFEPIDEMRRS